MIGSIFLKQYQAISFLGKGSMGSVYLARHLTQPEVVVVKVMNREAARNPDFRLFFDREIASLTQLRHPCIVSLYGSDFTEKNGPCLVMEFIPGITLQKLLERHKTLNVEQVYRLLIPLCRALACGHARQITHRDLKPANLMVLDPDTKHESLKVMDFGLAQLAAKPHIPLEKLKGTDHGFVCGTPLYVAPEGLRGDPIDHRADLYSLGAMLFELLMGVPPFNYTDSQTVLRAQANEAPPRFAKVRPGLRIAPEIEALVLRCLEKFPNERPQTAREIAEAFGQAIGKPLKADEFPAEEAVVPATDVKAEETPVELSTRNPYLLSSKFESWMPEPIAVMKLRGFAEDIGGKIIDSEPGKIRVQFGERRQRAVPAAQGRSLRSWFGGSGSGSSVLINNSGPDAIDMTLLMVRKAHARAGCLELTVILKPLDNPLSHPAEWHPRCEKLLKDMRAYLMAK